MYILLSLQAFIKFVSVHYIKFALYCSIHVIWDDTSSRTDVYSFLVPYFHKHREN